MHLLHTRSGSIPLFLLAILLLLPMRSTLAVPMVDAIVTPTGGGVFHYEFSVTSDLADLFLVSITDAPPGDPLIAATLTTPVGYLANYDSGLGLLDFIADTAIFFPFGTTSGFAFDSSFSPVANFSLFEAYSLADFPVPIAGVVNITQVVQVSEPDMLPLLGFALVGLIGIRWISGIRHQRRT
jgi:hypothetical protein